MQFRIQCGSHYNALHFKGVIICRRSHNLPINNDSPSHYLPGNFDWGVIILGESLLTVTGGCYFKKYLIFLTHSPKVIIWSKAFVKLRLTTKLAKATVTVRMVKWIIFQV